MKDSFITIIAVVGQAGFAHLDMNNYDGVLTVRNINPEVGVVEANATAHMFTHKEGLDSQLNAAFAQIRQRVHMMVRSE